MNQIIKIVNFLKKRPTDRTIRIIRILYALALFAVLGFGLFDYRVEAFGYFDPTVDTVVRYALFVIPVFWLVWGAIPVCLLHRRTMKRIMMGLGIFLMIFSILFIEKSTIPSEDANEPVGDEIPPGVISDDIAKTGTWVDYESLLAESKEDLADGRIPAGTLLFFFGLFSLALGITSKFVTSKCLKYREEIRVIRV